MQMTSVVLEFFSEGQLHQ